MSSPIFERLCAVSLSLSAMCAMACAPQIMVTRQKPAEISLAGIKQIAITGVTGSDGQALEGLLVEQIQSSNRFALVERGNLDKVRSELGLGQSPEFPEGNNSIGKLLPASALVWGRVDRSDFEQSMKTEAKTCSKVVKPGLKPKMQDYPCKQSERTGKATVSVQFRVFETSTAKILAAKTLTASENRTTWAEGGDAPAIDGNDLKQVCRRTIAADFLKVIAPFEVQEKVKLVEESSLPEIQQGNEYLKRGDNQSALELYGKALARANADPSVSAKAKARATYAHGVGLALVGDYGTAVAEIRAANMMVQESDWLDMEVRVKQWQTEARKLEEQRKAAEAVSVGESVSASPAGESPTKTP